MADYSLEEMAVVKFLNTYHEDESLRRYFLRIFDSPKDLFWHDKDINYKIEFSAIENGTNRLFWLNEFCNYQHLYIFSKLFVWHIKWNRNDILNKRLCDYIDKYFDNIKAELTTFPLRTDSLSATSILNMGFWTDQYRWHKNRKSPYFIKYAKEKNILNEEFYAKYADFLYKTNQEYTSKKSFEELMEYFSATDFVVGKSRCLCAFLAAFFHEETKKQRVEEIACDYVPSEIKWESSYQYLCIFVLLDCIERKSSNTNVIGPKSEFYVDYMKSEMENEKSLLDEKTAKRYESILTNIKNGNLKKNAVNSDTKNIRNTCRFTASLDGKSFFRGYYNDHNPLELAEILYDVDFPIKKNVVVSWYYYNVEVGEKIDFELTVKKESSNITNVVAVFSHRYKVKKSFWEKIFSCSGNPTLTVSVRMDIEFLNANSCVVNNIKWSFENDWPSTGSNSGSDYVFGEVGLDQYTYIP